MVDHFLLLQGLANDGHDRGATSTSRASRPTPRPPRSPAASSTASPCSPRSRCRRSSGRAPTCCSARRTSPARSPTTSWPPPRRPRTPRRCRSWSTPGTRRSTTSRPTPTRRRDHGRAGRAVGRGVRVARRGHDAVHRRPGAVNAFADRAGDPTSLPEMARRINPFLVESGPHQGARPTSSGLFDPRSPRCTSTRRLTCRWPTTGATATAHGRAADRRPRRCRDGRRRRPARADAASAAAADPRPRSASAGGSGSASPASARSSLVVGRGRGRARRLRSLVPTPAATWHALVRLLADGVLDDRPVGVAAPGADRLRHLGGDRHRARHRDRHVRLGRGVLRGADRVPALHPGHRADPAVPAVARASARARRSGSSSSGTVFFNILMIADVARAVPRELLNASYTLGAGRLTVLRRVILRHSRARASSTSPASTWPRPG